MYGESYILANDEAKRHINELIAEADAERRANEYVAGQKAKSNNSKGVISWLMDFVKPTSRITTRRI